MDLIRSERVYPAITYRAFALAHTIPGMKPVATMDLIRSERVYPAITFRPCVLAHTDPGIKPVATMDLIRSERVYPAITFRPCVLAHTDPGIMPVATVDPFIASGWMPRSTRCCQLASRIERSAESTQSLRLRRSFQAQAQAVECFVIAQWDTELEAAVAEVFSTTAGIGERLQITALV